MIRTDTSNWRDRAACAAAADVGRDADATTISQARQLADSGRVGAWLCLGILAGLGAVCGWTTSAKLLQSGDGTVNAAYAVLMIVVAPWLFRALWFVALLLLGRRTTPLLGRLVTEGLLWFAARSAKRIETSQDLAAATVRRIGSMLAAGSGGPLTAVGSGVYWTAYALVAGATLWILTAFVALGFNWDLESSWLPPAFGSTLVEFAASPLGVCIGSDELTPIAPAPAAAADDPEALAARRAWLCVLTAGITLYVLLPMAAWAGWQAECARRQAQLWQPTVAPVPRSEVSGRSRGRPIAAPLSSAAAGMMCTHVVRLERPGDAVALPKPLDQLVDLGDVDAMADLERVRRILRSGPVRIAVISWLPATPDRGVRRRLQALTSASTETPLLVLDGGNALRRTESDETAHTRLNDWRSLARETGVVAFECDLMALTDASRRRLASAIGHGPNFDGGREPATQSGVTRSELDPSPLDAAFGVIGRHLNGDDPLPSDTALASCLSEIARVFRAESEGGSPADIWRVRLAALRDLDPSDVPRRASSLTQTGLGLLPTSLRTRAVWAGVGGLLGVAACAAAATVAPVALVALPGWAATGAGVAGLLSLVQRVDDRTGAAEAAPASGSPADASRRLGESVFGASASAVLWWSQGADEARTTRALEALAPDDAIPALNDAESARRWLAAARLRVVAAAKGDA
ncbi:MAG: hypothetical protein OXU81_22965 [Gammaproteobacteria bacterium]|nr:hypothetical protein [Gammaproteobacteria bacterium]